MSAHTALPCPRRYCRARLEATTDGNGRVAFVCRPCERNARGLCRDCPAPTRAPRARHCERCTAKRQRARWAKHYAENKRRVLVRQKRRLRRDPALRARAAASKAAWYRANKDEHYRAYKRAYMRQWRAERKAAGDMRKHFNGDDAQRHNPNGGKRLVAAHRALGTQYRPVYSAHNEAA